MLGHHRYRPPRNEKNDKSPGVCPGRFRIVTVGIEPYITRSGQFQNLFEITSNLCYGGQSKKKKTVEF